MGLAVDAGLQTRRPMAIERASRSDYDEALPERPGIYAWWVDLPSPLPQIPATELPFGPWGLLYIGVAPREAGSSGTLRSRVLNQHVNGSVGSSTFRRALAAFIWEDFGWTPYVTPAGKLALPAPENRELTDWIKENLKVSWLTVEEPWRWEAEPIESLQPPLNSRFNTSHAFYRTLRSKRAQFADAARRNSGLIDD